MSSTSEQTTKGDKMSAFQEESLSHLKLPDDHTVTKTIVTSPNIYKPVGPYSQAVLVDRTLYLSGVLGLDPNGQMVKGGAEAQTRMILINLRHVLEAGGASLASVIKTTILLADIDDFRVVNQVYSEFFQKDCPARATFQVGQLPLGALVEIDAIALSGADLVITEAGPCPCSVECDRKEMNDP
ncbi:2-iminobutanoate/2-iminopropanoate deaminase-like [Pectinophora gossypiella]|uniref:2-iminobutanoate/2-iminopropanoate deaminase-like n=1 Tax=Pectinophora gossypiella TaxID=13191 RepID=UPI00214F4557|nr:2-iminobutanoate/2-iminopropanoate deaminase-like [Pectinophora gossypiella]